MGQEKRFIQLKRETGTLSFYKARDGHLVWDKGGIDACRIQRNAGVRRTRENGVEFGASGQAGRFPGSTVRRLLQPAHGRRVVGRVGIWPRLQLGLCTLKPVGLSGGFHSRSWQATNYFPRKRMTRVCLVRIEMKP
jgi:hypothetical protein